MVLWVAVLAVVDFLLCREVSNEIGCYVGHMDFTYLRHKEVGFRHNLCQKKRYDLTFYASNYDNRESQDR